MHQPLIQPVRTITHYTYQVYKNGIAYQSGSGVDLTTYSFTPNDNGSYRVVLTVDDGDGGTASKRRNDHGSQCVTVSNILGAPSSSNEGSLIQLTSSVVDPSVDTFSYSWQVTAPSPISISGGTGSSYSFTPPEDGIYIVSLVVTDHDGGVQSSATTRTINVLNVAPTAPSITVSNPRSVGSTVSVQLSSTDPGGYTIQLATVTRFSRMALTIKVESARHLVCC